MCKGEGHGKLTNMSAQDKGLANMFGEETVGRQSEEIHTRNTRRLLIDRADYYRRPLRQIVSSRYRASWLQLNAIASYTIFPVIDRR